MIRTPDKLLMNLFEKIKTADLRTATFESENLGFDKQRAMDLLVNHASNKFAQEEVNAAADYEYKDAASFYKMNVYLVPRSRQSAFKKALEELSGSVIESISESHLNTIIGRVKNRLAMYKGDEKAASRDNLWLQSIRNLMEYMDSWDDFTPEENKEAEQLYAQYSKWLKYEGKNEAHDPHMPTIGADTCVVCGKAAKYTTGPDADFCSQECETAFKNRPPVTMKLKVTNKGSRVTEAEPTDVKKVLARGLSDKAIADRIAREKKGQAVQDDTDPKKFMVIANEGAMKDIDIRVQDLVKTGVDNDTITKAIAKEFMGYVLDPKYIDQYRALPTEGAVEEFSGGAPVAGTGGGPAGIPEGSISNCPICNTATTHIDVDGKSTCTKCNKTGDEPIEGKEEPPKTSMQRFEELNATRFKKGIHKLVPDEPKKENESTEEDAAYQKEFDELTNAYSKGQFNFNQLVEKLRELNKKYNVAEAVAYDKYLDECATSRAIGEQEGVPESQVEELMQKIGVDFTQYNLDEILKGIKVEKEHKATVGDNLETFIRIAIDHLNEIPDYYTRLDAMEKSAKVAPKVDAPKEEAPEEAPAEEPAAPASEENRDILRQTTGNES